MDPSCDVSGARTRTNGAPSCLVKQRGLTPIPSTMRAGQPQAMREQLGFFKLKSSTKRKNRSPRRVEVEPTGKYAVVYVATSIGYISLDLV